MFIDEESGSDARVSTSTALRHVMVFQLKLAADAFRDFLLSPLSIVAFVLDSIRKPRVENSLYLRLMLIGRRSDRMINLFDDHQNAGSFTIDSAVDELEQLLRSGQRREEPEGGETADAPEGAAQAEAAEKA